MSRRLSLPAGTVLTAVILLYCSCSVGPISGTETGNPDITACLNSALSLFDSADVWIPSHYLIDGERQLNPENVYNQPSGAAIAKRTSSTPDTAAAEAGSIGYDTIYIIDTLFIRDTIILDTVVTDTIDRQFDNGDINRLVLQQVRHDSVFIVDTSVVRDTFLLPLNNDTEATYPGSDGSRGSMEIDMTARADAVVQQYRVVRDSLTGAVVLAAEAVPAVGAGAYGNPSLEVRTDTVLRMIARSITIAGVMVTDVYRDADGDGTIATAGNATAALLTCSSLYRSSVKEIDQIVDFDAGIDNDFNTVGNNRIHALAKRTSFADGTSDLVRYGMKYLGQTGDTAVLIHERSLPADSVEGTLNRYIGRTGNDPKDHRMNKLIFCTQTVAFRSGALREMELTLIPEEELAAGTTPVRAFFTAEIDFGKGLTGRIDAIADYRNGTVSGTYAQAGTEFSLDYHRGDDKPVLLPRR